MWWRILSTRLMASRLLVANESSRKERLYSSSFLMRLGMKSMRRRISKMIALSFYSLRFEWVTWISKHGLHKECSFKRFLKLLLYIAYFLLHYSFRRTVWGILVACYKQYFETSIKSISQPKSECLDLVFHIGGTILELFINWNSIF